jgi:hypothetical protein
MADMRKCIGSAKFGIEAHETPIGDFPTQPSQKDGLGRMCKPHWNQYTTALRKAALARKAAGADPVVVRARATVVEREAEPGRAARRPRRTAHAPKPEPIRTRPARGRKTEGEQIVEAVDATIAREAANVEEAVIA